MDARRVAARATTSTSSPNARAAVVAALALALSARLLMDKRAHDAAVDALRDDLARERRAREVYEARVRYLERWRWFGRKTRVDAREMDAREGRARAATPKRRTNAKDGVMV